MSNKNNEHSESHDLSINKYSEPFDYRKKYKSDTPTDLPPTWKELFNPGTLLWICSAIVFLLLSLVIELDSTSEPKPDSALKILKNPHLYAGLFREISFALFIALLMWIFVERKARQTQIDETRRFQKIIASDVLDSTTGLHFSGPYTPIRDRCLNNIYTPVVRSSWTCIYTFKKLPDDLVTYASKFLYTEIEVDFYMENISSIFIPYPLTFLIEKIPEEHLHKHACLQEAAIDNEAYDPLKVREEVMIGNSPHFQYRWPVPLDPGVKKHIRLKYVELKRICDNQLITLNQPAAEIQITIDNQYFDKLQWKIEPLYKGDINLVGPKREYGTSTFTSSEPILPYQGVLISWQADPSNFSIISGTRQIVYNQLKSIIDTTINDKKESTIVVLGLTLEQAWGNIKDWIDNQTLSNWEIKLYCLSPEFISQNTQIFPKDWYKHTKTNIDKIINHCTTNNSVNIELYSYENFPAFHGFMIGQSEIICAPIYWEDGKKTLRDPYMFYEYFPAWDSSVRAANYRKLFKNWLDTAKQDCTCHYPCSSNKL